MGGEFCTLMPRGTCFLDPRQEMRVLSHFPGRSVPLILGNGLPLRRTKDKDEKENHESLAGRFGHNGQKRSPFHGLHRRVTLQIVS